MRSLVRHYWPCLEKICETINRRETITYGELANKLGLKLARQEWSALLDLIAGKTKREVGDDLTWIVIYSQGPAKGLSRYFSNNERLPGSTSLDLKNAKQITDYKRKLKEIYKFTYTLKTVQGMTCISKVRRSRRLTS
jgi:hypothetical protein